MGGVGASFKFVIYMMKISLTFATLLFTCIIFGQKRNDYLISFTDTSSGRNLIGFKSIDGQVVIEAKFGSLSI